MVNSNEVTVAVPTQFSHTIKIEQTAKGARVTVHVSANNAEDARDQAIKLYTTTKERLKSFGEEIAPNEIKNGIRENE